MESFNEQVDRLEMMAEDDGGTWDLSVNDQAAIRAVLEELKRLRAATPPEAAGRGDGWIDVKQELPTEEGVRYLVVTLKEGKQNVNDAWYDPTNYPNFPWRDGFGSGDGPSVTHWRPLPAPPSGEQGQPSVNQGEASELPICPICGGSGRWKHGPLSAADIARGQELARELRLEAQPAALSEHKPQWKTACALAKGEALHVGLQEGREP